MRAVLVLLVCVVFPCALACGTDTLPETSPFDAGVGSMYTQPCVGYAAVAIPDNDCVGQFCTGASAYALCSNGLWDRCACYLPPGYRVSDAGFLDLDSSAPKDAGRDTSKGDAGVDSGAEDSSLPVDGASDAPPDGASG